MDEQRAPWKTAPSAAPANPVGRWDLVLILAGFLLTLAVCLGLGYKRIFWEDEMLGWMLLRDPSWHHMITAWNLGADGGGFAFYLTGRAWFALFGPSEVAFRMYSGCCFGAAFATTWLTARRFYTMPIVAFSLFNTFFFSPPIVLHMAEGRFYGLLTLATSLAIAAAVYLGLHPRTQFATAAAMTFAAHAFLTTSHLLGVVYSAFILAAQFVLDRKMGKPHPLVYLSGVASWLLLWPERTAILASAAVGKPHFWTTNPTFRRFVGVYSAFSAEIACVLLALAVVLAFTVLRDKNGWRQTLRRAYAARWPIWTISASLLLVPIAFLVEGAFGPSLFINRYLIPVSIALAFLTAELLTLIDWHAKPFHRFRGLATHSGVRLAGWFTFAALLLVWDFAHLRHEVFEHTEYTDQLTAALPAGLPVVCEDAWTFTELIGRQHASPVRYLYMLDWDQTIDESAPRLEVTQFHLMENWRKAGYFGGSIVNRDAFLRDNTVFLVIHAELEGHPEVKPEIGNPLAARFSNTPGYEVIPYGHLVHDESRDIVSLVCRGTCPADARSKAGLRLPT